MVTMIRGQQVVLDIPVFCTQCHVLCALLPYACSTCNTQSVRQTLRLVALMCLVALNVGANKTSSFTDPSSMLCLNALQKPQPHQASTNTKWTSSPAMWVCQGFGVLNEFHAHVVPS
eukprot:1160722-Pelagomonas_calceolata.AAC.10